jgi:nucleotide-binding universal stress UspA family protein
MAVIHRDADGDDASRGQEDEERALAYIAGLGMERGIEVEVQSVADRGRDPYEAILEAATEWGADFIFMGRTGRHGPGRALMGSQTEHVLEFSEVPVVVVPTHNVVHG